MSQEELQSQSQSQDDELVGFDEGVKSNETGVEAEDEFAVFGGEEVKVEPRRKDAHQATIIGVIAHTSEKGSRAIRVSYHSDDTGNDFTQDVYVPALFAEHTGQFLRRELGIEDLPAGEPSPTGELNRQGHIKIVGNQRAQYGMAIKNTAGDAAVQVLLSAARKDGRKPSAAAAKIETFEEYCEALNDVLGDLKVIVTRVPELSDENPRGFLKVSRVYHPSILEDPKASRFLKNYLRQWEVGQQN